MKAEVISFRKTILANTEQTLKERMKADGRIVGCSIRFYSGVEEDLQVRPYIKHHANRDEDLFTFAENTRLYITGDDDYFRYPVDIQFQLDDEMVVYCKNVNTIYDYTLAVDIEVAYDVNGDEF